MKGGSSLAVGRMIAWAVVLWLLGLSVPAGAEVLPEGGLASSSQPASVCSAPASRSEEVEASHGVGQISAGQDFASSSAQPSESALEMWLPNPRQGEDLRSENEGYRFSWEITQFFAEAKRFHRDGNMDSAIYLYETCWKQDPQRIEILPYLGLAYDQQGNPEKAIGYYLQYLSQEPEDDLVSLNCAVAYLHSQQYEEAIRRAQPLVWRVESPVMYNLLGLANLHLGHCEKAIGYLNQALAVDLQDNSTRINLIAAYLQAGRFEEAKQMAAEALRRQPLSSRALNNAGVVLEATGRSDLARLAFAEAAKGGLEQADINGLSLSYRNGESDILEAADLVDRYPDSEQARLFYVWALVNDGRDSEAAAELERWLVVAPETQSLHSYLGLLYYRLGQYEEAREQFVLGTTSADHYNASLCLTKLGRNAEALEEAERACAGADSRQEFTENLRRCRERQSGR